MGGVTTERACVVSGSMQLLALPAGSIEIEDDAEGKTVRASDKLSANDLCKHLFALRRNLFFALREMMPGTLTNDTHGIGFGLGIKESGIVPRGRRVMMITAFEIQGLMRGIVWFISVRGRGTVLAQGGGTVVHGNLSRLKQR